MSWLECLLPFLLDYHSGATIISLLESLFLLPLFICVFLFLILCLRIVIYYVIFRRRPGKGKKYDLSDKLYVLTGGTSGIGRQLAREIVSRNGSLILLARNPLKASQVRRELREEYATSTGHIVIVFCDLENLSSVRHAADLVMQTYERIDGLICNAGIGSRAKYEMTIDGFEQVIQTNCLGHALLTTVLSWGLQLTNGVVINVSSHVSHATIPFNYAEPFFLDEAYSGYQAYCRSKLMVNTFTMQAAETNPEVCYLAVYPGIVFTPIGDQFVTSRGTKPALLPFILPIARFMFWLVGRTVKQGAETIWPLLVDPDLRPSSGSTIGLRFERIAGHCLSKKINMDNEEVEAMRRALNKAIVTAIDIFVHPDKNVPRFPSPDIEMEPAEEPEAVANVPDSPFSLTRRLSKKKDKIVQSIKGFARRGIRRESSSEVMEDDAKSSKSETKETKKSSLRRIISPDDSTPSKEEAKKMSEKDKKMRTGPTATAERANRRGPPETSTPMKKAVLTKQTPIDPKKLRSRTIPSGIPDSVKEMAEKDAKKTSRFRTTSDNTDLMQGKERNAAAGKQAKIEEEDEPTPDENKSKVSSGTTFGSVSKFRVGSAESLEESDSCLPRCI